MRKTRVVLSLLAVSLAAVSVLAGTLSKTKYYRSVIPSIPGPYCDMEITLPDCQGGGLQCSEFFQATPPGGPTGWYEFYLSKRVDDGPCELLQRANG